MRSLLVLLALVFTDSYSQLYIAVLETRSDGSGSMLEVDPTSGAIIGAQNVTLNEKFPMRPYLKNCDHPYVVFSPYTQTWSIGCGRELIVIYTQNPNTYKQEFVYGLEFYYTLERNGLVNGAAQLYHNRDRLSGCFRFHPQPVYQTTNKLNTFCYVNRYLGGPGVSISYDLPPGFNISSTDTGIYFFPQSYYTHDQPYYVTVSNGTETYLFEYSRQQGLVLQILFPLNEKQLLNAVAYTHESFPNISIIDTVNDGIFYYDYAQYKLVGGAISLCSGDVMHQRVKASAFDSDHGRLYSVVNCNGNTNLVTFDFMKKTIINTISDVSSQFSGGWLLYRMTKPH